MHTRDASWRPHSSARRKEQHRGSWAQGPRVALLVGVVASLFLTPQAARTARLSNKAGGRNLNVVEYNLWNSASDPNHAWDQAVYLELKNQLVDFQGFEYGSPEYQHARWRETRRRLQAFQRQAAAPPSSPGALARPPMNGVVINGTYYVQIGLGTPQQKLQVTFDTGSSILWTNCDCISCPQQSTIINLNPYRAEASTTSQQVPCNNECATLKSNNYGAFQCIGEQCSFRVKYGDQSTANGPVIQDVVSMPTPKPGGYVTGQVYFGCGRNQSGLLVQANGALDGLLGMGLSDDSMLAQLAAQNVLPQVFSFCLDSEGAQSHAILGRGPVPKTMITTPLVRNPLPGLQVSYYYVGLQRITVSGSTVQGSDTIGSIDPQTGAGGVIVDSGTTLTNLPGDVFQNLVTSLNSVLPQENQLVFDNPQSYPCARVQSLDVSQFPNIMLHFKSGTWPIRPTSYLLLLGYGPAGFRFCLGLMSMGSGLPSAIIGESWLTDSFVQIDAVGQTLGWAPLESCSSGKYFGSDITAVPAPPFAGAPAAHPNPLAPAPGSSRLTDPTPPGTFGTGPHPTSQVPPPPLGPPFPDPFALEPAPAVPSGLPGAQGTKWQPKGWVVDD